MKNIKRIAAIILVLAMAFVLTACGGSKLNGAWTATSGTALDALLGEMGGADLTELGLEIVFDFQDDDVFVVSMSMMGVSESMTGTWEVDGDFVTMTIEGDPLTGEFDVNGDELTLTFEDGTIVFEKN